MRKLELLIQFLRARGFQRKFLLTTLAAAFAACAFLSPFSPVEAQNQPAKNESAGIFKVGERITYSLSFGNFNNIGYAEIFAASSGKLAGKDAVELRTKFKTSSFVNAAFYELDESRTTFASAESGFPLYTKIVQNSSVMPKETVKNYLTAPAATHDFVTLIYQIRRAGGSGSFTFTEDEKVYAITLANGVAERVKTDEGEFSTNVASVQSEYFTEKGIKDFRINFSADERVIPVLIRFKTGKGEFRANLASLQMIETEIETAPTPTPLPAPRPIQTPKPAPTPVPYQENQPLLSELPFDLGEALDFQISQNSRNIGTMRLQAKERKQFAGQDSLFLTATVTEAANGNGIFAVNDSIVANVNPDTLAPQQIEIKFTGSLSSLNQTAQFDQRTGSITQNGTNRMESPVGTHSIVSLFYAIRSFNLKPSKDSNNPVNDTRVAVFYDTQPYIFILRPSNAQILNLRGEQVSAQLITIITGNPQLDQAGVRLWLSNDEKRLPLRITFGTFQADLISETQIPPK